MEGFGILKKLNFDDDSFEYLNDHMFHTQAILIYIGGLHMNQKHTSYGIYFGEYSLRRIEGSFNMDQLQDHCNEYITPTSDIVNFSGYYNFGKKEGYGYSYMYIHWLNKNLLSFEGNYHNGLKHGRAFKHYQVIFTEPHYCLFTLGKYDMDEEDG